MKRTTCGKTVGSMGLVLVASSWGGVYLGTLNSKSALVPQIWLAGTVAISLGIVAGIIASILHSKWWYCFVAVACLSLVVLLAAVGG